MVINTELPSLPSCWRSVFARFSAARMPICLCIFIVVEPQEGTLLVLQDWIECCILLHELRLEERSFAVHVNSQHHFDRCRKI
jgi:hypothetical protein